MRLELGELEHPVQMVALNFAGRQESQDELVSRCAFPLWQDVEEVQAAGLLGLGKDDMAIYDSQGELARYLPFGGSVLTNLGWTEGYDNVKNALLDTD
jgi:hypothetical protein